MTQIEDIREQVRTCYGALAESAGARCGCAEEEEGRAPEGFGAALYAAGERESVPAGAVGASLGCGNPTGGAELLEGETVLDLGSGAGTDVLLAAKRVGPSGKVYGLDMTEEMLALAARNREAAGARNLELLKGYIEEIPLPAATVDVVISNCVINLSADKSRVFAEAFRVLRPGGRLAISDVVASNDLSPADRAERGSYVGCIAGALSFAEYEEGLTRAGFAGVSVTPTHEVLDGIHAAVVRAVKPAAAPSDRELPIARSRCC
ncbi:MAG: arsenite methyltransferase [Acidobacteria bacterium]|nr:arsenite methyltransferase [Acidobacteriota bacterium]